MSKIEVTYLDHMGSDLTVVNAARVSFAKQSTLNADGEIKDEDYRLLKYLAKHGHWTPFAHPQISLHIKAPIFVRAQLFKHKVGLTENEVSRRYVTQDPEFYLPTLRRAAPEKKQGSAGEMERAASTHCLAQLSMFYDDALHLYHNLLSLGVAPEQARAVLPQGTMTEWIWTGSLAAFARVDNQRTHEGAQAETRTVANLIADCIEPLFPASWYVLTRWDHKNE